MAIKGPCLILNSKKLHFADFFSLEMLQIFFHIIFGRNNEDFCILCLKDKRWNTATLFRRNIMIKSIWYNNLIYPKSNINMNFLDNFLVTQKMNSIDSRKAIYEFFLVFSFSREVCSNFGQPALTSSLYRFTHFGDAVSMLRK